MNLIINIVSLLTMNYINLLRLCIELALHGKAGNTQCLARVDNSLNRSLRI